MEDQPKGPWHFVRQEESAMKAAAVAFYETMRTRRTVRDFSTDAVPQAIIENCIRVAGTAPNGANLQPWHFVAIKDPAMKQRIREAGEAEEREFYANRAPEAWLDVLKPLRTDARKPFLTEAPWLIAIFAVNSFGKPDGGTQPTYYPKESVGIATGFLISALHLAGLVTLTHTPSPMKFLNELLDRPATEKPFLLLIVGYPKAGAEVPDIRQKPLGEIATII